VSGKRVIVRKRTLEVAINLCRALLRSYVFYSALIVSIDLSFTRVGTWNLQIIVSVQAAPLKLGRSIGRLFYS
jgi:hypothetical protein